MRAYWIRNTGTTTELILRDVPRPEPTASQLLVRTRATSINRGDMLARIKRHSAPDGRRSVRIFERTHHAAIRW